MGSLLACEALRVPPPRVSAASMEEELAAGTVRQPQCTGFQVMLMQPDGGEFPNHCIRNVLRKAVVHTPIGAVNKYAMKSILYTCITNQLVSSQVISHTFSLRLLGVTLRVATGRIVHVSNDKLHRSEDTMMWLYSQLLLASPTFTAYLYAVIGIIAFRSFFRGLIK